LRPIAGLAAGPNRGADVASGPSEAFGSFLLIVTVDFGGFFLVRMFLSRRTPSSSLQYAGPGWQCETPPQRPGAVRAPAADRFEPVMRRRGGTACDHGARARYPPGFDPRRSSNKRSCSFATRRRPMMQATAKRWLK
jgi:hypothetical protein